MNEYWFLSYYSIRALREHSSCMVDIVDGRATYRHECYARENRVSYASLRTIHSLLTCSFCVVLSHSRVITQLYYHCHVVVALLQDICVISKGTLYDSIDVLLDCNGCTHEWSLYRRWYCVLSHFFILFSSVLLNFLSCLSSLFFVNVIDILSY